MASPARSMHVNDGRRFYLPVDEAGRAEDFLDELMVKIPLRLLRSDT